jgi:peptidyl-prolyl cis-trans isomerase D
MQKHKKYLVITLWISVIAFVGAGFVGWGSYSYNKKDRVIMTVGDIDINMQDFQTTYSNIYSYYSQMFQGNFDEAKAKELGLQAHALNMLKREALLLNLANEYGLEALDKEVANAIYLNPAFLKDGNFSRETYETLLKNIHMKPKEYEDKLKREILVKKITDLFSFELTPLEKELFQNIFTISDKLEYKIVSQNDVKINIEDLNQTEVKNFWELNKNRYLTSKSYTVSYVTQDIEKTEVSEEEIRAYFNENSFKFKNEEDKVPEEITDEIKLEIVAELQKNASEKLAIKKYINFKKDKLEKSELQTKEVIGTIDMLFSQEIIAELENLSNENRFLKPRFNIVDNKFYVIRLDEVKEPQPEEFETVKSEVELDLLQQKESEALQNYAKNNFTTFSGTETPFVTVRDGYLLQNLKYEEATEFLSSVFKQQANNGFIQLERSDKIIMYKVKEQKINTTSEETNLINAQDFDWIQNMKTEMINDSIYKKLENYYHIEEFYNKG